jgi:hypothetical protein
MLPLWGIITIVLIVIVVSLIIGLYFGQKSTNTIPTTTAVATSIPTNPDITPTPTIQPPPRTSECLVIFDFDRTLTAQQQETDADTPPCFKPEGQCAEMAKGVLWGDGIRDAAFDGGNLVVSDGARTIINVFDDCLVGVISAGDACCAGEEKTPFSFMKQFLATSRVKEVLGAPVTDTTMWAPGSVSPIGNCTSVNPFLYSCTSKGEAIEPIKKFWASQEGVMPITKVHFFDDVLNYINQVSESNPTVVARQVSCGCDSNRTQSQEGICGMRMEEMVASLTQTGKFTC